MEITVTINSCSSCRHNDHSGGFTIRGARQICGHSGACKARRSKDDFFKEYPEYPKDYDTGNWKYHWYNRITDGVIPEWCPLKHGSNY